MLDDENLMTYYKINFQLMHEHNLSLSEIEQLIPWERDVMVGLVNEWIKKKHEAMNSKGRK